MALCSYFPLGPTFYPWGRSSLYLLASPIPTLPGPSSGSVHWYPGLILGQLSCHCKSAPIIRHLVPALSREQKEPGQTDPGWRQEGNQALGAAAWDTHHFHGWCQEAVPGLSGLLNTEEPGAWRVESIREPGCRCSKPLADGGMKAVTRGGLLGSVPEAMIPA